MKKLILPLTLAIFVGTPAFADAPEPTRMNNATTLWFANWVGLGNATLKVATPSGQVETIVTVSGSPIYSLPAPAEDGVYRYELRAATHERIPYTGDPTDRDEEPPRTVPKPFYQAGAFFVTNDAIVTPQAIAEEPQQD